jgi:hypothetical protein
MASNQRLEKNGSRKAHSEHEYVGKKLDKSQKGRQKQERKHSEEQKDILRQP